MPGYLSLSVATLISFKLKFNYSIQTGYILTAISNNPTLINQLNSLVNCACNGIAGQPSNFCHLMKFSFLSSASTKASRKLTYPVGAVWHLLQYLR